MALYDDLINNDTLTREQKAEAIKARGEAERKAYDTELNKAKGRMLLGSVLSGASMHPIFNIPYVGTGVGGAMYDAGQAIVEGDKLPDIAKRAGRGFVIGETVGAIPYVGKAAGKTKAGQAIGNQASKLFDYLADTKAGQKLVEIVPKVEDVLMTDIKGFRQNKDIIDKTLLNSVRRGQAGLNPLGKRQGEILYNEISNNGVSNGGNNKMFDILSDNMSEAERLEKIEDLQAKGGYSSKKNKSNRALAAELEGKDNISNLAKKLGLSSKEIKDILYSNEWHHTNKNFTKTKYYATDAYLDLKNNNEISQQTIDKYDLSPFDIQGIKKSWEDLQKKLNAPKAEDILNKYREIYKNDENLLKDLDKVLKRSTKNEGLAVSEIRRMLQEYQLGNIDEKRLADSIHFYSTEAKNLRKANKN